MKINPIINENSVTVFPNGRPLTIRKDHVNFYQLRKACKAKDWDAIERLSTVENTVKKVVSDSKAPNVEIRDGQVFYKGQVLGNVVSEKLLSMIRDGAEDVAPWVRFIEKLMANPDRNSVEQLYNFLSHKELPITIDGDVIGYKGVSADYWSKNGNLKTRVLQGKVDERGRILNEVGATIEIERNCVVNDPNLACAEGIHVGSFDYAVGWAGRDGRVVLVSFNPADAVSVPVREVRKLRTCKYKVVADVTGTVTDIKKSCVSADGSHGGIEVSDADLREAIDDLMTYYDVSEIDASLLEEEGWIPYGSNVTDSRVNGIIAEIEEGEEEEDAEEEKVSEEAAINKRIAEYVRKKKTVYAKQIQSALSGVVNLTCKQIMERCAGLGFKVMARDCSSKSIIKSK